MKVNKKLSVELAEIAVRVLGVNADIGLAYDILKYSIRKCELNGKDEDYLPLMYENELRDYLMREAINVRGAMNGCAKCAVAAEVT